jgi:predicted kinase
MEVVIFIGIQASGKSTFYCRRFSRTHVRINLDMLKTRRREAILVNACLEAGQRFVVDNTNMLRTERAKYIALARQHHFTVRGYYFQSKLDDAIQRNAQRPDDERISVKGIRHMYSRLQFPDYDEGFDELFYVCIGDNSDFVVEDWQA